MSGYSIYATKVQLFGFGVVVFAFFYKILQQLGSNDDLWYAPNLEMAAAGMWIICFVAGIYHGIKQNQQKTAETNSVK